MKGLECVEPVNIDELRILCKVALVMELEAISFSEVASEFYWEITNIGNAFMYTTLTLTQGERVTRLQSVIKMIS